MLAVKADVTLLYMSDTTEGLQRPPLYSEDVLGAPRAKDAAALRRDRAEANPDVPPSPVKEPEEKGRGA